MINLQFDVDAAKEQLTQVLRDRISAQGAVQNVQNVDLAPVAFQELQANIADQDALLAGMKADLLQAQTHCQTWSNEIQPQLTAIPQATINYASLWKNAAPLVLAELRAAAPNREVVQSIFTGFKNAIEQQIAPVSALAASLQSLKAQIAADAANFSEKHAPFQQLEALDRENITAAHTALEQIRSMMLAFDEKIGVDTVETRKRIGLGTEVIKKGSTGGPRTKGITVIVGVTVLVTAFHELQEIVAAIRERLQKAREEAEFDVELNTLTAQVLALETASSSLAELDTAAGDLIAAVDGNIAEWRREAANVDAVITQLSGTQPVTEILNEFDIQSAQSKWDAMSTFAESWQAMEFVVATDSVVAFDDPADQTPPASVSAVA